MAATQAAIKTTITTTTTTTTQPTTTTTAATTTTTTMPSPTRTEAAEHPNACVLASALSATCVILFFTICGIIYYLYQRKKKKSSAEMARTPKDAPILPNKSGLKGQTRNPGFESDYNVPPKREAPLPRKKGGKKEELTISPYHGTLRSQEDYMVPPSRNDSFIEPPLPPNLARKLQKQNENDSLRPKSSASSNSYYLDMEGIKDDLYQNVDASSDDDIYINNASSDDDIYINN